MKALKIIGIILLSIIVLIAIAVAVLPSKAHVERSVVINAKPSLVYSQLSSMKKFNKWSPWTGIDPETVYNFEGPESGVGSKMSWQSDHQDVGSGSQSIVEAVPDKLIKSELAFDGFDNTAQATFTLNPEGEQTNVTWSFDSDFSGLMKLFGVMMDGQLGPYYEKGLAQLKEVVESLPQYSIQITQEETEPIYYIGIKSEVSLDDPNAIKEMMGQSFGELMGYVAAAGKQPAGMPICVYHDMGSDMIVMEPAIPTAESMEVKHDKIEAQQINASKVVKGIHLGDYEKLGASHDEITAYMQANNLTLNGNPWEQYVNDPSTVDTTKWETHIYYPVN